MTTKETFRTFSEGQQKYAPTDGLVCILQDPFSHSREETLKTARAVFHIDGPFLLKRGHIWYRTKTRAKGPLVYHGEGFMVFAPKAVAEKLNAA